MPRNSSAAFWTLCAPTEVFCAACATPEMLLAISPDPLAPSEILREISFVVAFCSSMETAIFREMSLIWTMMSLILPIAATDSAVCAWIASILRLMSSVAFAV